MKVDQLIALYIETRDAKKSIETEQKAQLRPYTERMEKIASILSVKMSQDNTSTLTAKGVGTAFQVERVSTKIENWEQFFGWVMAREDWDMLTQAASKTAVVEYAEKNGELPPGVKLSRMKQVQIRK